MVNLQTLKVMRGVLRGMIAEPKEEIFLDMELNFYLSLAQFDVARRLRKINKDWFSIEKEVSCAISVDHSVLTIPSDCLEIILIRSSAMSRKGETIRLFDNEEMGKITSNSMYAASSTYPVGFHVGNEVYIYPALAAVRIIYVQSPSEISNENDNTIIPVKFIEHVLAYAKWLCAPKTKHINPQEAKKEYDDMFFDIVIVKKSEVKAPSPDTPEAK